MTMWLHYVQCNSQQQMYNVPCNYITNDLKTVLLIVVFSGGKKYVFLIVTLFRTGSNITIMFYLVLMK